MKKATILSGIDRLSLADEQLRGRRVGLMTNPTGMNRELKSTIDIVNERYNQHLTRGSLIIEVGSSGNTLQEAVRAVRLFGESAGAALAALVQ